MGEDRALELGLDERRGCSVIQGCLSRNEDTLWKVIPEALGTNAARVIGETGEPLDVRCSAERKPISLLLEASSRE